MSGLGNQPNRDKTNTLFYYQSICNDFDSSNSETGDGDLLHHHHLIWCNAFATFSTGATGYSAGDGLFGLYQKTLLILPQPEGISLEQQ